METDAEDDVVIDDVDSVDGEVDDDVSLEDEDLVDEVRDVCCACRAI